MYICCPPRSGPLRGRGRTSRTWRTRAGVETLANDLHPAAKSACSHSRGLPLASRRRCVRRARRGVRGTCGATGRRASRRSPRKWRKPRSAASDDSLPWCSCAPLSWLPRLAQACGCVSVLTAARGALGGGEYSSTESVSTFHDRADQCRRRRTPVSPVRANARLRAGRSRSSQCKGVRSATVGDLPGLQATVTPDRHVAIHDPDASIGRSRSAVKPIDERGLRISTW